MIPIEFFKLRTFDETKSFGHESILDLRNRARDLVGFNFAVRRKFPLQTIPALVSAKEKISMRFFWDCELDGAVAESKYLPGLSGHLAVEEPWPASKRHDKLAFVRMAYGAPPIEPLAMSLKTKGPPSDVWHLACHANTKAKNSVDYYLRLRGEQGGSFDVTLDDLQGGFSELMEDGVAPMEHKPFVFMNACGSSRLDPQVSSSFPSFWLENGFPGCIGTEIEVDDVVAARLSRYFYDAIVSGESLGTAMHRARMTLLERHRNPLGILWTLYANPRVVLVLKRGG